MIQRQFAPETQLFRVRLGHLDLLTQARNEQEARRNARQQWRVDLPRLWDVITSIDDERLVVERV